MSDPLKIQFDAGTLVLSRGSDALLTQLPGCRFDERTATHRAEARWYRPIVELLRRQKVAVLDEARNYQPIECTMRLTREPFAHQREALQTWWNQSGRGVV